MDENSKDRALEALKIIGSILTASISVAALAFSIYSFSVSNQTQKEIAQMPYKRYVSFNVGTQAVYHTDENIDLFLKIEIINTGNMGISFKEIRLQKKSGEHSPGDEAFVPDTAPNNSSGGVVQITPLDEKVLEPGERVEYWIHVTDKEIQILKNGTVALVDSFNNEFSWGSSFQFDSLLAESKKDKKSYGINPESYKTFEIKVPLPEKSTTN